MSEQSYERIVGRLEAQWESRISLLARNAVHMSRTEDPEERHDIAKDAVEKMLFDSLEWEAVEATDISDIAYEAATQAVRGR